MKLKTKITLLTLGTVLTIFIIAMGINTLIFYGQAKEFRDREIDSSIFFFLSEINNATSKTEIIGRDLAQAGEIIYNIKSSEKPKDSLATILKEKMKNFPNLVGGGIWYEPNLFGERYLGPYASWNNNNIEVSWEYSNETYNYFTQSWYLFALPEKWNRSTARALPKYRTAPYMDTLGNEKVIFITLCTIMYDKAQKIIGMSTIDWTLQSVKALLSKLDITKSSFAVLIDKESKKILFHPEDNYLLKDYRELPWLKDNDFKGIVKNKISMEEKINIKSQSYTLYLTESDSDFILVVAVNEKEAYAVIEGIIVRNTILTVVTLLIIGVMISFIVGRSIQPLMSIIDVLRGITSGEKSLKDRIKIKSRDEFGELANTYNIMADTIEHQNAEIKEYTENLEDKVKARTNELNQTLQEVTKLKMQQDGDYFLTALLLAPLGINRSHADTVKIDYLLKQKKEFDFRKKKNEIGGDICAADSFTLGSRNYSVFLNADAMGKSIQGAGGALILGSVFHAIVERTKVSKSVMGYTPERWIKNTFIELHKTFETFDGSMLVSMILGLVDNENGFCYLINAEHPFAVLYRDGKASFIQTKSFYRKLGTPDAVGGIVVDTFQILPGDVLLLGSDGRDDIYIGKDSKGERIINEDENLFLTIVESSEGNLKAIKENIQKQGEITDDLSLLRLEYIGQSIQTQTLSSSSKRLIQSSREFQKQGDNQKAMDVLIEANGLDPDHPDILREMMKVYLNTKSYVRICELAIPYISMRPDDLDMLYLVSYCQKKLKKYESALDYAERLKIRDPNNILYMVNLAEIHLVMGNTHKAQEIADHIRTIEEDNDKLLLLEEAIRSKSSNHN
jgi:tetratricopeptide (TPR) repeat protein